jgi:hypothetical protein
MGIRLNAPWQDRLDERILELLDEEPWSTPSIMEIELPLDATEAQIKEHCMVLADVELIAVDPRDNWRCELDTRGKLYLDGEIDVEWHPPPRSPRTLQEGKPKWSWRIGPY